MLSCSRMCSYYRTKMMYERMGLWKASCRMCSLTVQRVLLSQNVFSAYRMCSLTAQAFASMAFITDVVPGIVMAAIMGQLYLLALPVYLQSRMCSLAIECVLFLQNVFWPRSWASCTCSPFRYIYSKRTHSTAQR